MKRFAALAAASSLVILMGAAQATTINFDTLGGTNGDTFSSYSEGGFTVTATAGDWRVAKAFGNPIPDVYCPNCAPGTLKVTGGLFSFDSVDIAEADGQPVDFSITGYRNGTSVYSQTGTANADAAFQNFAAVGGAVTLDQLFISISTGGADGNVDNIALTSTPVPEAATLALFGAGLAGFGALRRRRKKSA